MSGIKGEKNCFSKLKSEDVLEIRALAKAGIGHYTIADMFGVSGTTIKKIVRRDKWKWLK